MENESNLQVSEDSTVTIDIKSLVGVLALLLFVAGGVYFTLTSEIAALQIDVIRMQDSVETNEEFRNQVASRGVRRVTG